MEMPSAVLGMFVNGASLVCNPIEATVTNLLWCVFGNYLYELYHPHCRVKYWELSSIYIILQNSSSHYVPIWERIPGSSCRADWVSSAKACCSPCARSDAGHSTEAKLKLLTPTSLNKRVGVCGFCLLFCLFLFLFHAWEKQPLHLPSKFSV